MKRTKDRKNTRNIIFMLALGMVVAPLLLLGNYNFPMADDWSFGASTHDVVAQGGNIFGVLREAINVVMLWREKGEPRFSAVFFGTLQPGIWGERFYCFVPWIMIGSIIVSEILLCRYFLCRSNKENRRWVLPVAMPTILIQLLCVPFPVETFYWYTGAVNYTFVQNLALIMLIVFLKLKYGAMSKKKTVCYFICGIVLSIIIGGNNYATSLTSVCVLVSLTVYWLWKDRKGICRILPMTLISTMCLVLCLVAPGNMVRLEEEFGGATNTPVYAIVMSLVKTFTNIISWTDWKIFVMLLMILPFLWVALKNVEFSFKCPIFFTVYTFGIYASQIVATMYVNGTTGGCRMADILYYAYHIWLILNLGYWLGWIQKKYEQKNIFVIVEDFLQKRDLQWIICTGILLVGILCVTEIKYTSTYRAIVWLVKGYAKEYEEAWEERLEVLNDPDVKEVYFDPLPGYEEMIFYADFKQGENWVNDACEIYYEKDYIGLK